MIPPHYLVKKGPADPFRGNWYLPEVEYQLKEEAIQSAASLTLQNKQEMQTSWEQYGYEWSVFEHEGNEEIKIWEGYKYIQGIDAGGKANNFDLGLMIT